ncbi:autotransporter domain-containing protein [Herbaspirillum huttiense F1]|uniref:autotransporter family protein n=1 Tax=Herbaspirillum huttiense TaxID=863372 RepID=UPI002885C0FB|nr:autotransporter domain-containing protein [Herbaspirillum huttiense]MDT0358002.1 autotransporter domain-containing protein [Herbaspirillum huttiense F1]
MNRFCLSTATAAVSVFVCSSAYAVDIVPVNDAWGTPFISARFYSPADPPWGRGDTGDATSVRVFTAQAKTSVLQGIGHWAEIIRGTPGEVPALINVGTISAINAFASSDLVGGLDISPTLVQSTLQNRYVAVNQYGAHGAIGVGLLNFATTPYVPSQLPQVTSGMDMATVIVHEIGHALGITSSVGAWRDSSGYYARFSENLSQWTSHLRDDNGKPASSGQTIWCSAADCNNVHDANIFDVKKNQGYFAGQHVSEVLAGAMPGVPVSMLTEDGTAVDDNFMSHIELKNSLMSHQSYRNYTTFMEAELAVLQDLGYNIDRRNFFGSSIYGSGLTVINDNGFFQRNADGTAYIPGTYNQATLGLGLHVYGSYNTVIQRADLLSVGIGGAGIRVDGAGNNIVILPSTRVYAQGLNGRGVMFAYGTNHTLNQRGDIQALGPNGIAVSFDFGQNAMGSESDYRGSYIWLRNGAPATGLLSELDGPLVKQFDLTGSLAGRFASIYISDNAYVGQINVMRGASLRGDILSRYAQVDGSGAPRLTDLTFGRQADANGNATSVADSSFVLRYDGNIIGIDNLALSAVGGTTSLNGNHAIYSVNVAQGATLAGASRYRLNAAGLFTNAGTVTTAAGAITVDGNYKQVATGNLVAAANSNGTVNSLTINGSAALNGMLTLSALPGWYANSTSVTSDQWLVAASTTGAFSSVIASIASPTLTSSVTALGGNTYRLNVARPVNVYARYATDANSRSLGLALSAIAGSADANLRPLLAALDFSAVDGSTILPTLRQLSPAGYNEMFAGALLRERQVSELVTNAAGLTDIAEETSTRRGFAAPFVSSYRRSRSDTMAGADGNTYGVVLGAPLFSDSERTWSIGVHGAVSGQSTHVNSATPGSGSTTALNIGLHTRYAPDSRQGWHAFALIQAGVEDGRLDRTVSVNGYTGHTQAKWTGTTASANVGSGWHRQLDDAISIGTFGALDYTILYRPGLTESGDGARLQLNANSFHSLRTRLGAEWRLHAAASTGSKLGASVMTSWNHELLDNTTTQDAKFAGYQNGTFAYRSSIVQRDSLSARAGFSYLPHPKMVLETSLGSTVWRDGAVDLTAVFSANLAF